MEEARGEERRGEVHSVFGPVVVARNLGGVALHEIVLVGPRKWLGEVIKLEGGTATIQVYENTSGLSVGDPVWRTGKPLSVELGPGLLSNFFDGLQRPLAVNTEQDFIPSNGPIGLDKDRQWPFEPNRRFGVGDVVTGGDLIGTVKENSIIIHRIMVPPGDEGIINFIADTGNFTLKDVVLVIQCGKEIKQLTMMHTWPVRKPRPSVASVAPEAPLITGQRVLDVMFPCTLGGTAVMPGAWGAGKSTLNYAIAKYSNADVVVFVACGERSVEFVDNVKGYEYCTTKIRGQEVPLTQRMVIIANTSNMPVAGRDASIFIGITIGEYFRDMGYNAVVIADSTSRWGEALREISSSMGELPGDGGYPAYLGSRLASFYERAGRVQCLGSDDRIGSATIVGTVSPPGGDFSEPLTTQSINCAQVFWALDRKFVQRKHFPAVNYLLSHTRCLHNLQDMYSFSLASDEEYEFHAIRAKAIAILEKENELFELIQVVGKDGLSQSNQVTLEVAKILSYDFLQQNPFTPYDLFCPLYKSSWMLRNIILFHNLAQQAVTQGLIFEDKHGEKEVKKFTWKDIRGSKSDILYKLSCMKFQDPAHGEKTLVDSYEEMWYYLRNEAFKEL